jgi:hypothetical protein
MKKFLLFVSVFFILTGIANAQKVNVGYRDFYLGMTWKECLVVKEEEGKIIYREKTTVENVIKECKEMAIDKTSNPPKYESKYFDGCIGYKITKFVTDPYGRLELKFIDEKLASIQIVVDKNKISSFVDAVHEKWGKPARKKVTTYQNAFGSKIDGFSEIWEIGGNFIFLNVFPEKIDELYCIYSLQTKKYLDIQSEQLKKDKPKI